MKKCLFGIFTIFLLCQVFGSSDDLCINCPKPNFEKYYFSIAQLLIDKDDLFINIENHIIPLNDLRKDAKGYFIYLRSECTFCEGCGDFTWSDARGCCVNPPSRCRYSCGWRSY